MSAPIRRSYMKMKDKIEIENTKNGKDIFRSVRREKPT